MGDEAARQRQLSRDPRGHPSLQRLEALLQLLRQPHLRRYLSLPWQALSGQLGGGWPLLRAVRVSRGIPPGSSEPPTTYACGGPSSLALLTIPADWTGRLRRVFSAWQAH